MVLVVKNHPANGGDIRDVGLIKKKKRKRRGFDPWVAESPLEKGMATYSSILAWRIPWTEESGGL